MENTIQIATSALTYTTPFNGHFEQLQALCARLGDGAATTDELRDVMQVVMGICLDLSRQTLLHAGLPPRA